MSSISCNVRRRVHFAETQQIVSTLNRQDLSISEMQQMWWQPKEFEAMIKDAKDKASETRKTHYILCDGLDQAFQRSRRISQILQLKEENDNDKCAYLSEVLEADLGLRVWCEYGISHRGLERLGVSSQEHRYAREKVVRKGVAKVVAFSRRLSQIRMKDASALHHNDDDLIRKVAEHNSCSSIIFARMMGLADAHAAEKVMKLNQNVSSSTKKVVEGIKPKVLPTRKLPSRESLIGNRKDILLYSQ